MIKKIFILFLFSLCLVPKISFGSEIIEDKVKTEKAKVIEVVSETEEDLFGNNTISIVQEIKAEILSGDEKGRIVVFENDYTALEEGEKFFILHVEKTDGTERFMVSDPYRINILVILFIIFVGAVYFFGKGSGLRGLISLSVSIIIIFALLIPLLLRGYNPVLISVLVSSLIIILSSYITHGFGKATNAAVIGMIISIIISGTLATLAVHFSGLTGFGSEESVYLNFNTRGSLDLSGILLGGILIGLLGTLYDAAISQAIIVEELHRANPAMSKKEVYKRALRVGREHIGALVDTLAIAYLGAAMPLLLLLSSTGGQDLIPLINKEIISAEIVRILVGSIGVILSVPITTLVASRMLHGKIDLSSEPSHHGHSHSHGHIH